MSADAPALEDNPFEIRSFQSRARALKQAFIEQGPQDDGRKAWLQLAADLNPEAALDFDRVATAVESLHIKDGQIGELADFNFRRWDPLTYIEQHQFSVADKWTELLRKWETDLTQNRIAREHDTYFRTEAKFKDRFRELSQHLAKLDEHMKREYFRSLREIVVVDAHAAWRAVHTIARSLEGIQTDLDAFTLRLADDAVPIKVLQEYYGEINTQSSLRRRRREHLAEDEDFLDQSGSNVSTPASEEAAAAARESVIQTGLEISTTPKIVRVLASPSQTRLLYSSWTVICISCVFTYIASTTKRPEGCEAQFDDAFWTYLSNAFITPCALYCTILPQMRDKAVTLKLSWFRLAIFSSAILAILSPIVNVWSRQASLLTSAISNMIALLSAVQLAGGIQVYNKGIGIQST